MEHLYILRATTSRWKLGTQVEKEGSQGWLSLQSINRKKKIELVDLNTFAEEIDK